MPRKKRYLVGDAGFELFSKIDVEVADGYELILLTDLEKRRTTNSCGVFHGTVLVAADGEPRAGFVGVARRSELLERVYCIRRRDQRNRARSAHNRYLVCRHSKPRAHQVSLGVRE